MRGRRSRGRSEPLISVNCDVTKLVWMERSLIEGSQERGHGAQIPSCCTMCVLRDPWVMLIIGTAVGKSELAGLSLPLCKVVWSW